MVQADGRILIGGGFTTVFSNGIATARSRISRLNADGSVESATTFNPGTGLNDEVFALAVQIDGKILIGGGFTSANGTVRNRIARLNANGSLESLATFNPGAGANGTVYAIAVQTDGKILIGGNFSSINGTAQVGLARLNADGSLQSTATFNPGMGVGSSVDCIVVQPDGKILIGGAFSTNGTEQKHFARLNADGSPETAATFDPGTGPAILAQALQTSFTPSHSKPTARL